MFQRLVHDFFATGQARAGLRPRSASPNAQKRERTGHFLIAEQRERRERQAACRKVEDLFRAQVGISTELCYH